MKERGILFSGPMVKAIMDGSKTQTRRQVKFKTRIKRKMDVGANYLISDGKISKCPYGKVGDQLWVRETFCEYDKNHIIDSQYAYRANMTPFSEEMRLDFIKAGYPYQWKPSIFMPRKASRLLMEITEIRAEKLQEISYADAKAEGVEYPHDFCKLWESINGAASWLINPWVWVVTFKLIEKR